MAGEIKSLSIQFQIGYKRWYGPALKTFYLHRQGILGKPKDQDWVHLEEHLQDLLAGKEVDAVLLRDFEPVEPPHTLGFPRLPFACKQKRTIWQEHWVLEGYGGLKAHRDRHKAFWHNVKNRANRLKRRFGENWSVETFNKPDQLSRVLGDTESVARKTWQRRLGGESFHSPELAARYHHLLKRGLLEARILYVEGRPAAFLHGVAYKGNFFAEVTGYDPAYTDFGPGTYLTGELLKEFLGRVQGGFMDWGWATPRPKSSFATDFTGQQTGILLPQPQGSWPLIPPGRLALPCTFPQKGTEKRGPLPSSPLVLAPRREGGGNRKQGEQCDLGIRFGPKEPLGLKNALPQVSEPFTDTGSEKKLLTAEGKRGAVWV
jgi:hypothetical protein